MAGVGSNIEIDREHEDAGGILRVAIIDDHVSAAEGLAQLLDVDYALEVVGFARCVAEGIELIERTLPDVAIVNDRLPDGDGAEATRAILMRRPQVAVIMLTDCGAIEVLARAIEAGCVGFLDKGLDGNLLLEAVHAVARGEVVFHAGMLRETVPLFRGPFVAPSHLTAREFEILGLLAHGATTDHRADHFALNTVRDDITSVLAKLGAHSRLEAVAVAMRAGLIG